MENLDIKDKKVLISFKDLSKNFGDFHAVTDVNMNIHEGEVVGFLGPNGAGKSTTMKMMANLLKPSSGEVWIRRNEELVQLTRKSKDKLLRQIGFLIENPALYKDTTPRKILTYFAKLKGYPRSKIHDRVEEVVKMVGMLEWIDKKCKTFSKGMTQKIGIVSAIVHDPDIVVLDEPHTGLDPTARKEIRDFILGLKEQGKVVFLSSHLLFEVAEVADRVAIISHGKIIALDTIDILEQKAKNSVIRLELMNHVNGNYQEVVDKLKSIILPITGLKDNTINYNSDIKCFEVFFNGEPKSQYQILKSLIISGIEVVEYSVPNANLLENLYINLVNQSNNIEKNEKIKMEGL